MATTTDYSRYSRYIRLNEDRPDLGVYMDALKDDAINLAETEKDLFIITASEKAGKIAGKLGAGFASEVSY